MPTKVCVCVYERETKYFATFYSPLSGQTCTLLTVVNRETDTFSLYKRNSGSIFPSEQTSRTVVLMLNVFDTKSDTIAFYFVNLKFCFNHTVHNTGLVFIKRLRHRNMDFPGHFAITESSH